MEIALIICDDTKEAKTAKGFLEAAGATVTVENCTDLSVHGVEGTTFPSEYHKMGNFILVTGKWP
jgi:hypothetical protein